MVKERCEGTIYAILSLVPYFCSSFPLEARAFSFLFLDLSRGLLLLVFLARAHVHCPSSAFIIFVLCFHAHASITFFSLLSPPPFFCAVGRTRFSNSVISVLCAQLRCSARLLATYFDQTFLVYASPHFFHQFLVACTRLYKSLCRSVGLSVGRSVGLSVCRSVCPTLLFLRF